MMGFTLDNGLGRAQPMALLKAYRCPSEPDVDPTEAATIVPTLIQRIVKAIVRAALRAGSINSCEKLRGRCPSRLQGGLTALTRLLMSTFVNADVHRSITTAGVHGALRKTDGWLERFWDLHPAWMIA